VVPLSLLLVLPLPVEPVLPLLVPELLLGSVELDPDDMPLPLLLVDEPEAPLEPCEPLDPPIDPGPTPLDELPPTVLPLPVAPRVPVVPSLITSRRCTFSASPDPEKLART
jgi:hypothetical protein